MGDLRRGVISRRLNGWKTGRQDSDEMPVRREEQLRLVRRATGPSIRSAAMASSPAWSRCTYPFVFTLVLAVPGYTRYTAGEIHRIQMTLHDHGRYQVVPRSPDRKTGMTAGLQESRETFGHISGPVGRPVHNRFPRIMQGHLGVATKTHVRQAIFRCRLCCATISRPCVTARTRRRR
jgi:hypothetical protein